jgi:HK97 family phage major capsid protein
MERLSELTKELRAASPANRFARFAFAAGQANVKGIALEAALERYRGDEALSRIKTAVAAGSTASGAWGSQLVGWDAVARDFVEITNATSILGALESRAVRVPFNVRCLVSTSPTSAAFTKPGGAIPVSAGSLTDTTQLPRFKIGVIRAFTQELFAVASAAAEANVRDSMVTSLVRGIDASLIDPDSAGVSEETPASLTSGINPLGLFGATAANALSSFSTLLQAQVTAGSDLKRVMFAMNPSTLLALSLLRGTDGAVSFPGINATGGEIAGIPIFATASAVRSGSPSEKLVVCIDAGRIVYADDSQITLDVSRLTQVQMDDTPTNDASDGTGSAMVSAFQTHSTMFKVVRYLNWTKAASSAVTWMTANY